MRSERDILTVALPSTQREGRAAPPPYPLPTPQITWPQVRALGRVCVNEGTLDTQTEPAGALM